MDGDEVLLNSYELSTRLHQQTTVLSPPVSCRFTTRRWPGNIETKQEESGQLQPELESIYYSYVLFMYEVYNSSSGTD